MARKFTNENNYPHWLYHTLTTNNYTKGTKPSDISVTRLIDSPQINALRFKHADELVEDVKDRVWSCLLYTSPSPRDGLLSRMPSSA